MKRVYYLLTLWSLFGGVCWGQALTQKQMQDDLLFLQNHIHQYFSPLPLLEQRTGIHVDGEYAKLKKEITSTTSIEAFTQIIRQGLNMLNDGHSQIIPKFSLKNYIAPDYYLASIGNVSLADTINADYYYKLATSSQTKAKINIMVKYINGVYYNIRPFEVDGMTFNAGERISAINGIPMNQFIKDNFSKMYYLMWDPISSTYYSRLFTAALPLLGMDKFILTIGNKDVTLKVGDEVKMLQQRHMQSNYRKMMLICNDILYIRMPEMSDANWYVSELFRTYTTNVRKIVIDVRNNAGGNDGVWIDLLRKIIDKPLKYTYHVGMNHNEAIEKAVTSSFPKLRILRKGAKTELYRQTVEQPDSNSIHFKGKIYVLQDEYSYSAATALSSVAWQNKNIELIGAPTACIAGYTLPAIAFKLPNSEIVFTLAFSADLAGGKANPYMDKVKVPVLENDIVAYSDKVLNHDCYSLEYLANNDKLIEYVKQH